MSEEEIIKEIEIIKEAQDIMEHNLDIYPPKEDIYRLDTKQLKAVICLLELYNKQQKEIEEVRQANKRLFEMGKDKAMTKLTNEIIENDYISKDKIRDKIKTLEEKIHIVIPNQYNQIEVINEFKNEGALNILEELLLEE